MSYAWVKRAVADSLRVPPGGLRQLLDDARTRPFLALSKMPWVGEMVAATAATRQPPVLVASLPRAGSSWIGSILGASEGSLYLREPMTQSYLARVGRQQSPFFEWSKCRDTKAYDRFAARSFRGVPGFDGTVVPYPEQWGFSARKDKRVVIKEVNPLILERLHERFKPRIVLLVRHPVPVARSFQALGWTGDQFTTRFSSETLETLERERDLPRQASMWEQWGAFQATAQNIVRDSLATIDHLVVRYEDVCENPVAQFSRIFEFSGLPFSAAVRAEIERSSRSKSDYVPGSYDTVRQSRDMKDRWRREVDPADAEQVRRGYFAYRPIFYSDESDW